MRKKRQITLRGESVEILEGLSEVMGLPHRHVVELLLRKYGAHLADWLGESLEEAIAASRREGEGPPALNAAPRSPRVAAPPLTASPSKETPRKGDSLELPTDPGQNLRPLEL